MNKKYKSILTVICFISILLVSNSIIYVLAQNPTSTTILGAGSLTDEATYIIWPDGGYYFSKNGETGDVEFSGTNATTIITSSMVVGYKKIILKGEIVLDGEIILNDNTVIEIIGSITQISNDARLIFKAENVDNIEVYGGSLYGNPAQPTGVPYPCLIRFMTSTNISIHDIKFFNSKYVE